MNRFFEDADHVKLYRQYRPKIPTALVERILKYLGQKRPAPHSLAVDVGCGSGQTTLRLAPYFDRVLGTDVSPAQIDEASKEPEVPSNVTYEVAAAESLPVTDGSVDLLIATMCIHWFDLPSFYAEAKRVLKPDGVLCAVGHTAGRIVVPNDPVRTEELYKATVERGMELFSPYFRPGTFMVFKRYRDLDFPLEDCIREDCLSDHVDMTVSDYIGVTKTYSPCQQLLKEKPEMADLLLKAQDGILEVLGQKGKSPDGVTVSVRHEFFFVMGRKKA